MFTTKRILTPLITTPLRRMATDDRTFDIQPIKPRFDLSAMRLDKNTLRAVSGILHYFNNPTDYKAKGLTPPKGILLSGAPDTGKTISRFSPSPLK